MNFLVEFLVLMGEVFEFQEGLFGVVCGLVEALLQKCDLFIGCFGLGEELILFFGELFFEQVLGIGELV